MSTEWVGADVTTPWLKCIEWLKYCRPRSAKKLERQPTWPLTDIPDTKQPCFYKQTLQRPRASTYIHMYSATEWPRRWATSGEAAVITRLQTETAEGVVASASLC